MKKAARKSIRQNYWILLVFCLLAAITGVEFSGTLDFMSIEKADILNKNFITIYENSSDIKFFESKIEKNTALENMIVKDIKAGDDKAADKKVDEIQESLKNDKQRGVFGHSRGIFAKLANNIDSRQYLLQSAQALNHIIKSPSMVGAIITFGALIYQILIGIFIYNVLAVIIRRIFLESRLYTEVALNRGLFLVRSKCWLKAVKTTLLKSIFLFLWMFTVIGYFIKHYSYLLVPFIVAENPQIPASKTITLSREMMDGYKWQAFVMHLSLLGWILLGTLTLGLSNLFFGNMYKTAAFTEFYVKRREDYLKQNSEARNLLKDTYLYEYADKNTLNDAYDDVIKVLNERQKPSVERSGISGFFAKNLGVVLRKTALDQAYSEQQEIKRYLKNFNAALEGTAYPTRLAPIINKERLKILSKNNYMRRYAILNLFLIFIITCMIGWTYEVSIHLIRDGNFVNRGTMHGLCRRKNYAEELQESRSLKN